MIHNFCDNRIFHDKDDCFFSSSFDDFLGSKYSSFVNNMRTHVLKSFLIVMDLLIEDTCIS